MWLTNFYSHSPSLSLPVSLDYLVVSLAYAQHRHTKMSDQPSSSSSPSPDDHLEPTETTGYVAPARKTVDELKELDKNDESLAKWKESLLKNAAGGGGATSGTSGMLVLCHPHARSLTRLPHTHAHAHIHYMLTLTYTNLLTHPTLTV